MTSVFNAQGENNAYAVGQAIRSMRRKKRILQTELAKQVGMLPTQLCNLERGKNVPSLRTMTRIADALGVSVNQIVASATMMGTKLSCKNSDDLESSRVTSFGDEIDSSMLDFHAPIPTSPWGGRIARITREFSVGQISRETVDLVEQKVKQYLAYEDICDVRKRPLLPFALPFDISDSGAEFLARSVRLHCGVGTAIIFDTVELFESQGIRVIHTELPDNLESLSFYETQNDNVFLFLDKRLPVERRQFRMVYEIANSYLCAADYGRPASEAQENRRFAKRFSAAFLMPDDTVKSLVMQLNIGRGKWSYDLLLGMKRMFGVSAESFLYRLDELGLIDKQIKNQILEQIKDFYARNNNQEPGPAARVSKDTSRFEILRLLSENIKSDCEA